MFLSHCSVDVEVEADWEVLVVLRQLRRPAAPRQIPHLHPCSNRPVAVVCFPALDLPLLRAWRLVLGPLSRIVPLEPSLAEAREAREARSVATAELAALRAD